jgi:hypothetical protein
MILRSLTILTLAFASLASAQDVLDKVSKDACTCMEGVKMEGSDKDAFQMQLGLCFLQASMPYEKELKKKYDLDLNHMDDKTGEKLGMLVATRMATHCPDMLAKLASMAEEEEAPPTQAELEAANSSTLDGEVTASRKDGFVTLTVRSASGRSVEMLWLEFFLGSELLNNGNAQGTKGQFSYVERELFDAASGTYRKYNVLTGYAAAQ